MSPSDIQSQSRLDFLTLGPGESYAGQIEVTLIRCEDGRCRAFTTDSAGGFGRVPAGNIEHVVRGLGYVVDATTRLVLEPEHER